MQEPKKDKGGCGKAAGIGCGVLLVLVVLVVVLVRANLDRIKESDWYKSVSRTATAAKQELEHMLQLRSALIADYPADQINVNVNTMRSGGRSTKSLVVAFVNPRFRIPPTGPEPFARQIAAKVAALYPNLQRYDNVVISFVKQTGAGVTFKKSQNFPFPTRAFGPPAERGAVPAASGDG